MTPTLALEYTVLSRKILKINYYKTNTKHLNFMKEKNAKKDILIRPTLWIRTSHGKIIKNKVKTEKFKSGSEYVRYLIDEDNK